MTFTADLTSVSIVYYKNRFSVVDGVKVVFAGNLRVPQHKAFLDNVVKALPTKTVAA